MQAAWSWQMGSGALRLLFHMVGGFCCFLKHLFLELSLLSLCNSGTPGVTLVPVVSDEAVQAQPPLSGAQGSWRSLELSPVGCHWCFYSHVLAPALLSRQERTIAITDRNFGRCDPPLRSAELIRAVHLAISSITDP